MREDEQNDRVDEVIEHGLVPNVDKLVRFKRRFEPVRSKRAQRNRQKTKCRRDSDRHAVKHV